MSPRKYLSTATVAACTALSLTTANADEEQLRQEILNLKEKVEVLEEKLRRPAVIREPEKEGEKLSWFENITLGGLVEVEASYADTPDGSESDIVLATVELTLDAQVTPWVNLHVMLLYEQDDTDPPEFDEAIITIANAEQSPWLGAFGRMYLPFGNFDSNMVSDPLTLEIAETREQAALAGFVSGNFYVSAFLFNGDANEDGSSHIDDFGFSLGLAHEASDNSPGYAVGASWINNMADTDSLQEAITDPDDLQKKVNGIGVHGSLEFASFKLIGEYTSATGSFDASDLVFDGSGARPRAWNLEAGYSFEIMGRGALVGAAWQGTREALALELPESRFLATFSVEVYTNTALSLEYAHDEDYSRSRGGSGEASDTFTLQLAASF